MSELKSLSLDPYLGHLMATGATELHMAVRSLPRVRVDGRLAVIADAPETSADLLNGIIEGLLTKIDQTRLKKNVSSISLLLGRIQTTLRPTLDFAATSSFKPISLPSRCA